MNTGEFIKYISIPLTEEEMILLYKANNINYNKCSLFYDYIVSLNNKVCDTFLGDDVINSEKDILSHKRKKKVTNCMNKSTKNDYHRN